MVNCLNISDIKIEVSGDPMSLTRLEHVPGYIDTGDYSHDFECNWAAIKIMEKLKKCGLGTLLFPDKMKKFITNQMGIKSIMVKPWEDDWTLQYDEVLEMSSGINSVFIKIVSPCVPGSVEFYGRYMRVIFKVSIGNDKDVIDYINGLERKYIINYGSSKKRK